MHASAQIQVILSSYWASFSCLTAAHLGSAIEAKWHQTHRWNFVIFFISHCYNLKYKHGGGFVTYNSITNICASVSKRIRAKFPAVISLSPASQHTKSFEVKCTANDFRKKIRRGRCNRLLSSFQSVCNLHGRGSPGSSLHWFYYIPILVHELRCTFLANNI